jgi:hypothetical protein
MKSINRDWYFIPLLLVILVLVGANEWMPGIGILIFVPLMILARWLMEKAFGAGGNGE